MLGPDGDGRIDRLQPVLDALLGQPHHQIEAEVVEAGRARLGHGQARPFGGVQPRQPPKLRLAKRLDAEAQTVDAGRAERRQLRLVDGFGIGFERDFGVGRDIERLAAGRDDARDLVRLEQRRRAAAEERSCPPFSACLPVPARSSPCRRDLAEQRLDVPQPSEGPSNRPRLKLQ